MKQLDNRLDDIEELFDRTDVNDDDSVTLKEFRGLMFEHDTHIHESTVLANFLQIDTDSDGRISFAEFRAWWLGNTGAPSGHEWLPRQHRP